MPESQGSPGVMMDYLKLPKSLKDPVNWDGIRLLILDCDGVMTDGRIVYNQNINYEISDGKNFKAHDGMGFTLLHRGGLLSAVITGRSSRVLSKRCRELKVTYNFQKIENKLSKAEKLLEKLGLAWSQVVYMGDDWNDIPCMQMAAVSFCPADARPEIRHLADVVTTSTSAECAVRECIDYILYHKGIYEQVVQQYLQDITG
jgi:3-deoxy-D-manno-octulosonate 8-phosphate phosphatase (KDO 8-P phosphatase)